MTLVKVPIIAIVALLLLLAFGMLAPMTANQPKFSQAISVSNLALAERTSWQTLTEEEEAGTVGLPISEGGSFDPKDLCDKYNAAFRAAGVPNICTHIQLYYSRPQLGVIHFRNGDDLVASVDYGVDWSDNYKNIELPAGKRVWQTALRVYKPYTGQGIGQTIVRNYHMLLKAAGAQAGDLELIIASPDKKIMTMQYADAWEDFLAKLCIEWNATPLFFPNAPTRVGCWRTL